MHPEIGLRYESDVSQNIWWEQLMIYHMKTTPEPCAI
mgnify:FL=1